MSTAFGAASEAAEPGLGIPLTARQEEEFIKNEAREGEVSQKHRFEQRQCCVGRQGEGIRYETLFRDETVRAGAEQATMWLQLRPPAVYCYPPVDQKTNPG